MPATRFSAVCACFLLVSICVPTAPLAAQARGGMLNPGIDQPGKPFSYFWKPTDVVGSLFGRVAAEVTPEGHLYTGFGELMFFVGNPPEEVNERIKTLQNGYLPVVRYDVRREGVRYEFSIFAEEMPGTAAGLPVCHVGIRVVNESKEPRTAYLSSAYRFSPPTTGLGNLPDYRFSQRLDLIPQEFVKGQDVFNPDWKYSFGADALVRDDRVIYWFPTDPTPDQFSLSLTDNGLRMYRFFTGEIIGNRNPKHRLGPAIPMGLVTYRVPLAQNGATQLAFKMPVVPLPVSLAETRQVAETALPESHRRTVSSWEALLSKGGLKFPERKVQEFLLANTAWDLLAIDKVGENHIPNVNKFQYHRFYGGCDTVHMLIALDYMGLGDIAEKGLAYGYTAQASNGAFIPEHQKIEDYRLWESFGYALWGWGRHYLLTRDSSFLEKVYPGVPRAVEWLEGLIKNDPLGLVPPVEIADDAALKNAYQTGQSTLALIGLRNAVVLAQGMGKADDVTRFQGVYERYRASFDKQLEAQTAKSGGWIPPALTQTLEGNHWDNMLTLYPELLFDPFDPKVTATIRRSRATYVEGILGYVLPSAISRNGEVFAFETTPRLHYWQTQNNTLNALVRGGAEDQQLAVKDLYAMLLHTTSTHAPQEFGTLPWSTRDMVGHDLLPDGPASGKTIEVLRNMLVREYKNDLVLFSALSPAWIKPGQTITATDQPTVFGPVSVELKTVTEGLTIKISNRFRQAPNRIVVTIPWFYDVKEATVDAKPATAAQGKLLVSPGAREVQIKGAVKPATPDWSYEQAVRDYKREYRRRYEEFLRTGETKP
jgi:hypothetical protein